MCPSQYGHSLWALTYAIPHMAPNERSKNNEKLIPLNKTKNPRCIQRRSSKFAEIVLVFLLRPKDKQIDNTFRWEKLQFSKLKLFSLKARKLSHISAQAMTACEKVGHFKSQEWNGLLDEKILDEISIVIMKQCSQRKVANL